MPITLRLRTLLLSRARRAGAVTMRDITAAQRAAYWAVVVVGVLEPLLYLLSIGVGVGALIGSMRLPDGHTVPYAVFVAPAMLAASAMNAAVFETSIGFYSKMRYGRHYDATVFTPVTPADIAMGQLLWALLCGLSYSVAFLAIMSAMDLTTPLRALLAFPVVLLVSAAFGALGLVGATLMRGWQDFDYAAGLIFAMFLFSGTFMPVDDYPAPARAVAMVSPLYHGVSALRAISTGTAGLALVANLLYLIVLAAVCMVVASRRITRKLCP